MHVCLVFKFKRQAGKELLVMASTGGGAAVVLRLLAARADVDVRDEVPALGPSLCMSVNPFSPSFSLSIFLPVCLSI